MTVDEIIEAVLLEHIGPHEGFRVNNPREINGYLAIDQFAILPIAAVSSGVSQETDLEVIDSAGGSLGTLCFSRSLGNISIAELTIWQFVAFLSDAEPTEILDSHYSFKRDYLVLEIDMLDDYLNNYILSAPIWGKFSHFPVDNLEHVTTVDKIVAVPGIKIASPYHQQTLNRYLYANNPFERFLRIYHSIELLFDYVLVKKIKALDDNIFGFSQIYSDFGRTEIDRLRGIIREFCGNASSIASILENSSRFYYDREDIFFKYSKSANPFGDSEKWEKLTECLDGSSLNASTSKQKKLISKEDLFPTMVFDLAAYWIYRIRCSIAHNRVGEFVFEDRHRNFVAEFAEPLILEIAKQVFASPNFAAL
ncbi:hypothetical protein SOM26_15905 [Sphingomonas sp. CFBP8993]|uniref:hypothetical protein n=1 Tax=Sphingomonas sp. CFBP8993 TaxID=3096526 RepID=UPI002A6B14A4|nr:hypothetical protein [Sphingomonas sp. CFBP8993]MDY0960179.1 hypothetical protein [Sphingomonas sp. CFBP8993]